MYCLIVATYLVRLHLDKDIMCVTTYYRCENAKSLFLSNCIFGIEIARTRYETFDNLIFFSIVLVPIKKIHPFGGSHKEKEHGL